MIEQLINPEEEEIILINSAKKYNASASQVVLGLEYFDPSFKPLFEKRVTDCKFTYTELGIKDHLLKILV